MAPTAATSTATISPTAASYEPRDTQDSTLVRVLRAHLDEFVERTGGDDPDWRLPRFVERQLRAMIGCGDFTGGFCRYECCSSSCRGGRIVPFS
jgi:hypothetical protein